MRFPGADVLLAGIVTNDDAAMPGSARLRGALCRAGPFIWRKTADEILDNLARYLQRINDSGHQNPAIADVLEGRAGRIVWTKHQVTALYGEKPRSVVTYDIFEGAEQIQQQVIPQFHPKKPLVDMATIRSRGKGVWEVRVFTGNNAASRATQVSRTVRGAKRDALSVAAAMEAEPPRSAAGRMVGGLFADPVVTCRDEPEQSGFPTI